MSIDKIKGNVIQMQFDQLSNVDEVDYNNKKGKFLKVKDDGSGVEFDYIDANAISHFQNRLLIYYGNPLIINEYINVNNTKVSQLLNTDEELEIFYQYFDKIVLTLGSNPASYSDPDRSRLISLLTAQKEDKDRIIYGYISIGESTGWNLNTNTLQIIIDELIDTFGFNGIMIDHAGFDSGTTREKLNTIVSYCKGKAVSILINATNPNDIYDDLNSVDHFSVTLSEVQSTYNSIPTISEASDTSFLIENVIIDTVNIEGSITTENIGGNGLINIDIQLAHSKIKPETITLNVNGSNITDTNIDYYNGEFASHPFLNIDYETGRLYGTLQEILIQDLVISYDYGYQGGYKNIETSMDIINSFEVYRDSKNINIFASNQINVANEKIKKINDYDYIQQLFGLLINLSAYGIMNDGYSLLDNNIYLPKFINESLVNQLTYEQNINASKYFYDDINDFIYKSCDGLYIKIEYSNLLNKQRLLLVKSNFIYDYNNIVSESEESSFEINNIKVWHDGSNGYLKSAIGDLYLESESGDIRSSGKLWNSVYNDYADCIPIFHSDKRQYGYCYSFNGSYGYITKKKNDKLFIGISTDTAGYILSGFVDKVQSSIPIAMTGFVLAHLEKEYKLGTKLVPSKNGKLKKASFLDIILNRYVAKLIKLEGKKEWKELDVQGRHWVQIL